MSTSSKKIVRAHGTLCETATITGRRGGYRIRCLPTDQTGRSATSHVGDLDRAEGLSSSVHRLFLGLVNVVQLEGANGGVR